jgi:hypothetical protein
VRRLLLLAGVVVAAGCGGGGGGGDPETVIRDQDQARAEMIVFHLDDFPTGWAVEPDDNGSDGDSGDECFDLDLSDLTINGDADSDDFAAETTFASSTASIFETEAEARSAFERLVEKDLSSCLVELTKQGLEESGEDVAVKSASPDDLALPSFGDRSNAYRVRLQLESEGFEVPAVLDVVLMQRERAFAAVVYVAVLDPFPAELEEELTRKLVERMEP